MTLNARPESRVVTVGVYAAALLGAFLIVGGLTWFLSYRTRPAPLNQARIEERLQNLRDINAAAAEGLNTFGWQDPSKGLVRLSITTRWVLVVREWKDPAADARTCLPRGKGIPRPPPPAAQPCIFE